jgi:hypothetical protein
MYIHGLVERNPMRMRCGVGREVDYVVNEHRGLDSYLPFGFKYKRLITLHCHLFLQGERELKKPLMFRKLRLTLI